VYHVTFLADDGRGGRCEGTVAVCVPHSQKLGDFCVDQGALFDSTVALCDTQCSEACAIEMGMGMRCRGEKVPQALSRRVEKAGLLLARAAEATNHAKAKRMMTSALKRLEGTARIATHGVKKGTISPPCGRAVEEMIDEARRRFDL
jgi:hypothetical protein